jgi:hypothetical protein
VAMHYNFGVKIQSRFDDPIPVRRAGAMEKFIQQSIIKETEPEKD